MPKSAVIEDDPYPLPKDEVFDATLTACEEVVVTYTRKTGDKAGTEGSFPKWEWTYLVTGPSEYAGTEVKGSTEPKITDASESSFLPLARPVVEAFLGRTLGLGEEIDTDDLIGLPCKITIRQLPPRPRKNGDGHWFNVEVEEVYPAHPTNGTAAAAPVAPTYGEPPY